MDALKALVVSIATFIGTTFSNTDLPNVLGTKISPESTVKRELSFDSEDSDSDGSTTEEDKKRKSLEEAREEKKRHIQKINDKRREAIAERKEDREEFREKLKEIRDERKKEIVEKLDSHLVRVNDRWVSHWNNVLSRLREILAKISSRADTLEQNGKDVALVRTAYLAAETAINAAQDAVNAQAGKTYVIEITDEENLGQSVSSAIGALRSDLKNVKDKVKGAREKVHEAYKALAKVHGGSDATLSEEPED